MAGRKRREPWSRLRLIRFARAAYGHVAAVATGIPVAALSGEPNLKRAAEPSHRTYE
jgi:hypothetical protein